MLDSVSSFHTAVYHLCDAGDTQTGSVPDGFVNEERYVDDSLRAR